jgi:hypothetical protein
MDHRDRLAGGVKISEFTDAPVMTPRDDGGALSTDRK